VACTARPPARSMTPITRTAGVGPWSLRRGVAQSLGEGCDRKPSARVDVVVKVGGGLVAYPEHLDATLATIADVASMRRVVIVPGGGPFAEIVRQIDREFALSDDAAHWMAVLAMDQYAHLITGRLAGGVVVSSAGQARTALNAGRVPVLAVSQWLRAEDPLPHSWDVTSDSIAAWVAGAMGAPKLVVVKPPGADGPAALDGHFSLALSPLVTPAIICADRHVDVRAALLSSVAG
jgi:aspartokinase-like uncharacterized kinase